MRYASVCSGVEAASLAWGKLGWTPVFFAEVEPFPCAVLQQRFNATKPLHPLDPEEAVDEKDRKMRESWLKQINKLPEGGSIPNLGDFTKIKGSDYVGAVDLLVGGTPCQDLSVAGKRAGFEGARSSLALDFVRLAYEARCQYFVWENVPGVFSSNRGRDFATLLSMFCGYTVDVPKDGWKSSGIVQNRRPDRYGLAWRVLDAQFTRVSGFPFAVPQRRRRVFLVGCLGDWERAASILLEPDRLQWDTPPRIQTRKAFAGSSGTRAYRPDGGGQPDACDTITASAGKGVGDDRPFLVSTIRMRAGCDEGENVAGTLKARPSASPFPERGQTVVCETGNGFYREDESAGTLEQHEDQHRQNIVCFHGSQDPISNETNANAIGRNGGLENCVCLQQNQLGEVRTGDVAGTIGTDSNASGRNTPICYENHAQDSRVKQIGDAAPTINGKAGTGGNNVPLVQTFQKVTRPHGKDGLGERWGVSEVAATQNCFDQGDVRAVDVAVAQDARCAMGVYTNLNSTEEIDYGNAEKNRPSEILRVLRKALGKKAFSEWIGRHGSVPQEEILQSEMFCTSTGCETVNIERRQYMQIPCEETCPARQMRNLWSGECLGRASQGRRLHEQQSVESDTDMQELSHQGTSPAEVLCNMWQTVQGAWLLHEAFREIQEVRRSTSVQAESVRYNPCRTVRRLTPLEAEALMGFPDNHTRISWKGKPEEKCPDAPRYKACGNSFCCNVVEWIGRRIEEFDR